MKLKPEECSLVVARYNEKLNWLIKLPQNLQIFVYNKNEYKLTNIGYNNIKIIHCDNVGKEAETYLRYITYNYEKLTKWTIFCQGNPFDHFNKFLNIFGDYNIEEINPKGINAHEFYGLGNKNIIKRNTTHAWQVNVTWPEVNKICNLFYNTSNPLDNMAWVWGANMVVFVDKIRKFPKEWYAKLLIYAENNPNAPWGLEVMWDTIFNNQN